MSTIWLKVGLIIISRLTVTFRDYIEEGFDKLADLAKTTGNKIDDGIVSFLRLVILGGDYETEGTGVMEGVIANLTKKLSPGMRQSLYDLLLLAQEKAKETSGPVDDLACYLLIKGLFPAGNPGNEPMSAKVVDQAVTETAKDLGFAETSKAPGLGIPGRAS